VIQRHCKGPYRGSGDHFRLLIACYRPRPAAEAYLRLRSLPGEQAQVDWGHFGHLVIGRARRPLMAFVMVLSYSRQIFLRFFLDARMESFLRGHVAAFTAWNGCARVLLYDNLKSAVLERQGDAIRFHPTLIAFAGHYRYDPRPVAVALVHPLPEDNAQVALTIHLSGCRLDGGLDRFDGYIAAGFGVGAGHDAAGSESLREDGGGALGFALENALGADKSECQNRDVRVGNRGRRHGREGNDGEKPRGHELGEPDEDHGSSLNCRKRN
jgi:hypothetical protein